MKREELYQIRKDSRSEDELRIPPHDGEDYYQEGIYLANRGEIISAIASFEKAAQHFQSSNNLTRYQEALDQIQLLRG